MFQKFHLKNKIPFCFLTTHQVLASVSGGVSVPVSIEAFIRKQGGRKAGPWDIFLNPYVSKYI